MIISKPKTPDLGTHKTRFQTVPWGISALLVTLLASVLPEHASAQTSPGNTVTHATESGKPPRPASWIEGRGRSIIIKGERVCLRHRNPGSLQTTECALGFRGDDERFYALSDPDPYHRNIMSMTAVRFQVTGTLWPSVDDKYVNVGTIELREAKSIDDPKTLVGEYVCLPEGVKTSERGNCAPGIKTRGGLYWAFYPVTDELRARLSKLAGDRLAVEGTVMGFVQDEKLSRLRRTHPDIEGALRVIRVNVTGY